MGNVGSVKPGSWLHGPIKAQRTWTIKPHRAHLVCWALEAHGSLLLEAHWPRSRTWSHTVKALHGALKVTWSRPLPLKPHRGLLTNRTIKPSRALRVRRTIKPSYIVSHWAVRHLGAVTSPRSIKSLWHVVMRRSATIEPGRTLLVGPIKPG